MFPPKKVIEEPTSNGVSTMFHGAWYPNVVAQIIPSIGAGGSITVTLKGSMQKYGDGSKGVTLAEDTYVEADGTTPQKLVKPAAEWWMHYWLEISSETADATINEAWLGSGGS